MCVLSGRCLHGQGCHSSRYGRTIKAHDRTLFIEGLDLKKNVFHVLFSHVHVLTRLIQANPTASPTVDGGREAGPEWRAWVDHCLRYVLTQCSRFRNNNTGVHL